MPSNPALDMINRRLSHLERMMAQRIARDPGKGSGSSSGGSFTLPGHHLTHEPGGSDPMAVDAATGVGSLRTLGTGSQQAAAGDDSRLTDGRTPLAHHTTHEVSGTDAVTITHAQTTGQTVNDHHDKSHGHTGGDGSGTVAHGDTTGRGASTATTAYPASITFDSQGHKTAITAGSAPITSVGVTAPITTTGGLTPTIGITAATTAALGAVIVPTTGGLAVDGSGNTGNQDYWDGASIYGMPGFGWYKRGSDATNQEFDTTGSSPPTSWNWVNQASATITVNSGVTSCMQMTVQNSSGQMTAIARNLPNSGAAGDTSCTYMISTRCQGYQPSLAHTGIANFANSGLVIGDLANSGHLAILMSGIYNGQESVAIETWNAPTGGGYVLRTAIVPVSSPPFLRIVYTTGANTSTATLAFWYGFSPYSMQCLFYDTIGQMGFGAVTQIAQIGVHGICNNSNGGTSTIATCDWFRREA